MTFLELFNRLVKRKDVYFKYSNSEQFTGEYSEDDKKRYQKTISFTVGSETKKDIPHGISNIDRIWDLDIVATNGTFLYKLPIVYYVNGSSGTFYDTLCYVDKTYIRVVNNTNWSNYTFYATIVYTKTTG